MKTLISTPKTLVTALTVLALAGLLAPVSVAAQEKGAGAARLANPPVTAATSSATATMAGEKTAMGCASCRTTLVSITTRPTKTGAAAETKLIARNDCPDCVNTVVTTGTGKLAKDVVAHACKKCASENKACCAKN